MVAGPAALEKPNMRNRHNETAEAREARLSAFERDSRPGPRTVRPSWVKVAKADSDNDPAPFWQGTGPRGRAGTLSADFLARIDGKAVPFLTVEAIGASNGETVLWRITDKRTGRTLFEERVTQ